jgi:hypothetical protein
MNRCAGDPYQVIVARSTSYCIPRFGNDAVEPGAIECNEPFAMGDIFWICRLPDYLRDVAYKACEPQGEPSEQAY